MPNHRPKLTAKREAPKAATKISRAYVRASISFPAALYQTIEQMARDKRVSLAWVVRDAAEKYVGDKWPLFAAEVTKL